MKIVIGLLCLFLTVPASANMIKLTLIDHVETVTQFKNGETKASLIDSIILIGNYKGYPLLHVQGGLTNDVTTSAPIEWLGALHFRLDPFYKDRMKTPDHWEFLKSLQVGPSINYSFTEKEWFPAFNVSLAFSLDPKQ